MYVRHTLINKFGCNLQLQVNEKRARCESTLANLKMAAGE